MLSEISQSQKEKYCMIPLSNQRQKAEWFFRSKRGDGVEVTV